MTPALRFFRRRLGRRLMVGVWLIALLLAALAPIGIGIFAACAASLALYLFARSSRIGWNRIGPVDERERQQWMESKALAYPILVIILFPCLLWVALAPFRSASLDASSPLNGMLTGVLCFTMIGLPMAISAWRGPEPTED